MSGMIWYVDSDEKIQNVIGEKDDMYERENQRTPQQSPRRK